MPRITVDDAACAANTPAFSEIRSPLTSPNVQAWSRANFPDAFGAVPRASKLKWTHLDEFRTGRPVWRSLGRSAHKRLLVVGGYAPGPDIEEDGDTVLAHVHSDGVEVSFYRTAETEDGEMELRPCNSTSTVAFHAPFCDVGSDTGGSEAIHRVSALILYYFLASGHVKELARNKSDPTMFTRNFRDACAWVESGGERPVAPPSRRSSASVSRSTSDDTHKTPPLKRSATDTMAAKVKREREDETTTQQRKHPRRTLSEQIVIPKMQDSIQSPRTPQDKRVHRALQLRIDSLKEENADLKQERAEQLEKIVHLEDERREMRRDIINVKVRLAALEEEVAKLKETRRL